MRPLRWTLLLAVVLITATYWLFKPSRVLLPQVNGLDCITLTFCIEDMSRRQEAEALVTAAVADIVNKLGEFNNHPKFIFCATQRCFERFGFSRAAAAAVGSSGIVVGPRGWLPHYLKHELVHHWQAENIGVIRMLFVDDWLIEGMAYALSDDPRTQLASPWQAYRAKFRDWYAGIDKDNLLTAIDSL